MIDDKFIIENFIDKNGKCKAKRLTKEYLLSHEDEYEYLLNRFSNSSSLSEVIYKIYYKLDESPKCPNCGKELTLISFKKGFHKYCSYKCRANSDLYKDKMKQYFIDKLGVDNPAKSEKIQDKMKQTCIKRYGVDNIWKSDDCINRIKQTCIEKYGVSNFGKTKEGIIASHTPEVNERRINTMKKNGTLNTSKEELYIFEKLSEKFEVERHYKDKERYPFICDFYIPNLDLFIEYQGSMFHNKRPYLGTEDDLKEVEEIKQKSEKRKQITGKQKTRYDSLIETWKIRDVKKRETAKQNNLNYLEFFNIEEFKMWFEQL